MKYYWITLSLLAALMIGCNSGTSTEDPAADDGSASVTEDDGGAVDVDLPPMDETELTSTNDEVGLASTNDTSDDSADLPSFDEAAVDDPAAEAETPEAIRADLLTRVRTALQQRDIPTAITLLEESLDKLPEDRDMTLSLVALRLQYDMQLAGQEELTVALASMKETDATITRLLGEDPELPPNLLQMFHISRARSHAHGGDADQAIAALSLAAASGFDQFTAVINDPFFESLKGNDAFESGVEQMKKKATEQKLASFESFDFDFELTDLEGNPIKLSDYKGKLVIADIWGTWCPPCKAEIPHFVELQKMYQDDLAIVGITYERFEGEQGAMAGIYESDENRAAVIQRVATFAQDQGINYTIALGDMATQQMIPELRGFPTTLFIDRTGKVRLMVVGYHPQEQLEGYVTALLEEGGGKPAG